MRLRKPVGKAAGDRPGHPTPEGHVFVDVGRGRSFYKRTYPRHIMEDIGIIYGVDEMAGDGVPAAYFFDKRYGWTAESAKEFCEDRSVNIAEGMDIIKGVVHLRRPFRDAVKKAVPKDLWFFADLISQQLQHEPNGLTYGEIRDVFTRYWGGKMPYGEDELKTILEALEAQGDLTSSQGSGDEQRFWMQSKTRKPYRSPGQAYADVMWM